MTYKIKLSSLKGADPSTFGDIVNRYIGELTAWHQQTVAAATDTNVQKYPAPQVPEEVAAAIKVVDGTDGSRTFEADWEVVDDTAEVEAGKARRLSELFQSKKQQLFGVVSRMEHDAIHKIVPQGKRRLLNMRIAEVRNRDTNRGSEVVAKNSAAMQEYGQRRQKAASQYQISVMAAINKIGDDHDMTPDQIATLVKSSVGDFDEMIGPAPPQIDIAAEVDKTRPPEDQAVLDEAAKVQKDIDAAERHFAEQQAEIEDLTPETIDDWKPKAFG